MINLPVKCTSCNSIWKHNDINRLQFILIEHEIQNCPNCIKYSESIKEFCSDSIGYRLSINNIKPSTLLDVTFVYFRKYSYQYENKCVISEIASLKLRTKHILRCLKTIQNGMPIMFKVLDIDYFKCYSNKISNMFFKGVNKPISNSDIEIHSQKRLGNHIINIFFRGEELSI